MVPVTSEYKIMNRNLLADQPIGPINNPALPEPTYPRGTDLDVASATERIETLVSNLIGLLTIVAGIILTIMLIYGAIIYLAAGGDKAATEKGRKIITNAIVGIVAVVLAVALAGVIGRVAGLQNILMPDWSLIFPII